MREEQEKKRIKKAEEQERERWREKIKAKEVLTLTVMRNMEDGAKGDIMTLLFANQPLPFAATVSL